MAHQGLRPMPEKNSIVKWSTIRKEIRASTPVNIHEDRNACIARRAQLEATPEEWFRYYFPKYAYAIPADFHIQSTQRILANREWCEVRMWSRELAKSTRTMMEVCYLVLVGHSAIDTVPELKKRYVMLISNSLDNAVRLLMPYRANLQYNQRIIQDYGKQENRTKWQSTEFVTRQGVAFRALGAGQSPRGARNEEVRPDIILFDDVDTDADCLNPEMINKKWRWIEEAAIGTRSISTPTTIIFCGNRIAANCCIQRATKIADHVDEINIRDTYGHSVWPQKNNEQSIVRVLSQKSYAAQQKEYFNNPVIEGSVFKEMAYKPARPISEYEYLVCYTDPSYKTTNDYKATVLTGKWQGEYHVIKCYLDKVTTAQMITWHYNIMRLVGSQSCYYFMEQVFMQDVLMKEMSDTAKREGRNIPIRGDTRKKPDKFMRIESLLEPLHRNGQLYLNESERHNPHMQRLAEQFVAFAPGSRVHDDGPDAVEGAIWIINEKQRQKTESRIMTFGKAENKKSL